MVGYVEGCWHAEVVVATFLSLAVRVVGGALDEVEERRCIAVVRSLNHVMPLYERLPCCLAIVERFLHYVVSLIVGGGAVGSRVDEEVLRNVSIVLYDEDAEGRGVVVHRRIEDAVLRHAHRCGKVVLAGEVYSRCLRIVNVCAHGAGALAVGVIVEGTERRIAIVGSRAIHAVAHMRELVRSYLAWHISRFRLQRLSPEEVVVHQFSSVLVVIKQRHVMCSPVLGRQAGSVHGVRLVVTRLHLLVVGDVAELANAQIGNAGVLARDGICSASILIIAVGIIVGHVFQNRRVCLVACKQIILVEVVRHFSETEVVVRISLVGAAVPTIHHWC